MNYQCTNSAIRFCICCEAVPCHQKENNSSEQDRNKQRSNQIIASIENNFANLLQKQLRILSDRKEKQISNLEGTVSQLKSQIIKLESRNKLDKENQNRLKQQVKKQANKIRQLQEMSEKLKTISERKQTVIIKEEIKRPEIRPDTSFPEIQRLKQELVKVRTQKYEFEEMNKYLNDKISDMQKVHKNEIEKLRNRIEQLQKQLDAKNRDLTELSKRSIELQQKLTILSKPTRLNIQPIIIQKVTSLPPEIRTVYIDKPVQQTMLVQVQKIIKHFIQPQRPIVNRIVECSSENNKYANKTNRCCQDQQYDRRSDQINIKEYEIRNQQYENVIHSYQSQRDKMLKAIQTRDSDYRLLEKKIELIQKVNYKAGAKCGHGEKIEVTVVKHDCDSDRLTDSDKKGTKQGKTTGIKGTSKNTYTKTEQNVRKR